jgi:diguanylate cyclase (GGDEF)-like protein
LDVGMTYRDHVTTVGSLDALGQLRPVVDVVPAAFVAVDGDGRVTLWNPAAERLFGRRAADVLGTSDPTLPGGAETSDGGPHEVTRVRADGSLVAVTAVHQPLQDGRLTVYADGGERRRLEVELVVRAKQQAAVVRLGEVALGSTSMSDVAAAAVKAVAATLGLPAVTLLRAATLPGSERVSTLVTAAVDGRDEQVTSVCAPAGSATQAPAAAVRALHRRSSLVEAPANDDPLRLLGIRALAAVLVGPAADPWGVLLATAREEGRFAGDDVWFLQAVAAVVAAADARRAAEAEVVHRAWHDPLTGLPNRELLLRRTGDVLAQCRDRRGTGALLLLDLDGFKDVNDSHGHQAGDRVLVQVADRLRVAIGSRGLVARLGGDEFAVLLGGLGSALEARHVAEDLLEALEEPCSTPGGPARISGSIGVALAPAQAEDPTTLLMRADLAMYRAKRERAGHALFDARRDHDASERLALVTELAGAIADGGVRVEYQPIVALRTHRLWGAEALARWTSRRLGPQQPGDFVRLAETGGLIEELTAHVLRSAAEQAAAWQARGTDLAVSVNVSPLALAAPGIVDLVLGCVEEFRLPVDRLRLEVTEGTLANDRAIAALERLAAHDVPIALDDFGTGYSSLARLKRLPVTTLKVDRSFVASIADDPRDAALVRAVMTLARDLGLAVVAEGVETARAARAVTGLGVHLAQGMLYAPAMPVPVLEAWAARWARGHRPCCTPEQTCDGAGPPEEAGAVELAAAGLSPSRPG